MKRNVQFKIPLVKIERKTLEEKLQKAEEVGLRELYDNYKEIVAKEIEMRIRPLQIPEILFNAEFFYNASMQILEIAENSTVMRCCGKNGHVTVDTVAFESVGAHANLASEIVDIVLDALYGWGVDTPRHTRYEFTKVMRFHDLPENETEDGEDNLTRDETAKAMQEDAYLNNFANFFATKHDIGFFHVLELYHEMRDLSTEDGRIAYLADKLSAVIMVLCYLKLGVKMYAYKEDPCISEVNLAEIKMCDESINGEGYYFHEMWTNDFVFARELTKYDDSGIFTGLLVMITLICRNNRWYHWREKQYSP